MHLEPLDSFPVFDLPCTDEIEAKVEVFDQCAAPAPTEVEINLDRAMQAMFTNPTTVGPKPAVPPDYLALP